MFKDPICAQMGFSSLSLHLLESGIHQVRIISGDKHFSNIIMLQASYQVLIFMGRLLILTTPASYASMLPSRKPENAERGAPPGAGGRGSRIHEKKYRFTIWSLNFSNLLSLICAIYASTPQI